MHIYRGIEKISKYFKDSGSKFLIVKEGSYKYENWNEPYGIRWELEILMWNHSFWYIIDSYINRWIDRQINKYRSKCICSMHIFSSSIQRVWEQGHPIAINTLNVRSWYLTAILHSKGSMKMPQIWGRENTSNPGPLSCARKQGHARWMMGTCQMDAETSPRGLFLSKSGSLSNKINNNCNGP